MLLFSLVWGLEPFPFVKRSGLIFFNFTFRAYFLQFGVQSRLLQFNFQSRFLQFGIQIRYLQFGFKSYCFL